ncbi:macro domain-containing protein [Promicromonospora sp. NPDC059942]|uniref:type II toxin-antitoxin system antitoxin DNA ADP-ribosyl glycohydrolase DarG n=1 Tax=Promicromonospora sp. NPDC059942 TaxID=3347009 RepID=UPI00364ED1CC
MTEVHGDLLEAEVDALVNAVNTVGVMGKGIALQFRRAYPEMYDAYALACKAGEVAVGQMHVWPTGASTGPRYVVNFPTKKHWRARSQLSYIDDGLVDLVRVIRELGIRSIAVPPLGAGHGGLDWAEVRPRIEAVLAGLPDVEVRLYVPEVRPAEAS